MMLPGGSEDGKKEARRLRRASLIRRNLRPIYRRLLSRSISSPRELDDDSSESFDDPALIPRSVVELSEGGRGDKLFSRDPRVVDDAL